MQRKPWLLRKPLIIMLSTKSSRRTMVGDILDLLKPAIAKPRILRSSLASLMRRDLAAMYSASRVRCAEISSSRARIFTSAPK
ncbi:unnamed protein product [Heligmosomoides polygyrus]|uniref:Uncharacterized protein n=1 Tax=Heligmosomoides polygyrus TaxID=6339 RepID=A0A3P8B5T4_HELPZ|nr:unnamed protein product [Heligmosomoides polygyrus]